MELWDLYDKDRHPLGITHPRGEPVPAGAYHLAVIVVIVNAKGEILLTRRAPEKAACPGWWENTGGSALAGETSLQAIARELREETGLSASAEEFTLLFQENCRGDCHFDIFALTREVMLEEIHFQPQETDAARWVPLTQWEQVAGTGGTLCPVGPRFRQELYRRIGQYLEGRRDFSQKPAAPELWDLYGPDRNLLGRTHPRGTPLPEGTRHLAVAVAVFNSQGQILLTRRSPEKEKHPGCWEITGGCAKAGEDSLTAACRELGEETGIQVQPQELTLLWTDCLSTAFLDIYAVERDMPLDQVVFQPGETDAAQWMDFSRWKRLAGRGEYLMPSWHRREGDSLFSRMEAFRRGKSKLTLQNTPPERWDLYDKDRRPLGRTIPRGRPLQKGEYHLGVTVAVFNAKGEILSTRRAPEKTFPGQWEIPAGGVQAGESAVSAACRELREETGITAAPEELTLLLWQVRPHLHAAFYGLTRDVPLEEIILQPGETDGARWVPFDTWILEQEEAGKASPEWHRQFIQPLYKPLRDYKDGKRFFET
ncbi:MAG: NUDIX hydrolase [Acutalibacter sp.]